MAITIKRNLESSDYLTLLPLAVGFVAWLILRGVRYVPR